jgi:MSHA biogenesis protein MshK
MARRAIQVAVACALLAACAAQAQQLRDPTRPPSFRQAAGRPDQAATESGLVLQTVLISPQRRNATVSGRLLKVGDTIAGWRVAEIRESAVLLQGRGEQRTLELFPSVTKRGTDVAREPAPVRSRAHDDEG